MSVYFPKVSSAYTVSPPVFPQPSGIPKIDRKLRLEFFAKIGDVGEIDQRLGAQAKPESYREVKIGLNAVLNTALTKAGLDNYVLTSDESEIVITRLSKVLNVGEDLIRRAITFCTQENATYDTLRMLPELTEPRSEDVTKRYAEALRLPKASAKRPLGQRVATRKIARDQSNR